MATIYAIDDLRLARQQRSDKPPAGNIARLGVAPAAIYDREKAILNIWVDQALSMIGVDLTIELLAKAQILVVDHHMPKSGE